MIFRDSCCCLIPLSGLPRMAWTATRRNPFTSPFSLTMAILWIRGTGYIRYTKARPINRNLKYRKPKYTFGNRNGLPLQQKGKSACLLELTFQSKFCHLDHLPGKSVVEWNSTRGKLLVLASRGGWRYFCLILVHFTHQLQALSEKAHKEHETFQFCPICISLPTKISRGAQNEPNMRNTNKRQVHQKKEEVASKLLCYKNYMKVK